MKKFTPLDHSGPVRAILDGIPFLGGITDEQRRRVFRHFEKAEYETGEQIARKDENPSHIYIIKRGSVELFLQGSGDAIFKRKFREGESFGEAALLSLINETATFVAAEPCELIILSRRSLNALRKEDPEIFACLMFNMARELARKLQFTDEMLLRISDSSGNVPLGA